MQGFGFPQQLDLGSVQPVVWFVYVHRIGHEDPIQSIALQRCYGAGVACPVLHSSTTHPVGLVVSFIVFGVAVTIDPEKTSTALAGNKIQLLIFQGNYGLFRHDRFQ